MKVAILGAGAQGYVLTWHFGRRDDVERDRARRLRRAARQGRVGVAWGAGKTTAAKVDASDPDAVARFAAGADIIVNAVLPEWVVPVMQAALAVGAHYIDMATRTPGGTVDDGYEAQMALDERFKDAGRTALITTGMTPGVTNTLAAILYEEAERCEADPRARDLELQLGQAHPGLVAGDLVHRLPDAVALLRRRRLRSRRALRRARVLRLPGPLRQAAGDATTSTRRSRRCRAGCRSWATKGLRCVDFKMGASDAGLDTLQAIIGSGMASPEPREVKGVTVRPIDVLVSNLPPSPPPEEIAAMAREGKIVDEGVYVIDLHADARRARHRHVLRLPARHPGAHAVAAGGDAHLLRHLRAGRRLRRLHPRRHDHLPGRPAARGTAARGAPGVRRGAQAPRLQVRAAQHALGVIAVAGGVEETSGRGGTRARRAGCRASSSPGRPGP